MKIKALILGLVFLSISCSIPVFREIKIYPQSSEFLYNQMILTLQDLGFRITHTDKASLIILAENYYTGEKFVNGMSGVFGSSESPYQVSVFFKNQNDKIELSISLTNPKKIGGGYSKKWVKRILEKFEEKIK